MVTTKGERRKAAIVAAAQRILVVDGLDAISHRRVAGQAGVPLGATTYYFTDLHDLRRAAVDALAAADLTRMERVAAELSAQTGSVADTARVITELLTPEDDDELVAWYERYARAAREPLFATAARRINEAARSHVATVLRAAGLDELPPDVVLAIVDGAVLGALAAGDDDPRSVAAGALACVLTGGDGSAA